MFLFSFADATERRIQGFPTLRRQELIVEQGWHSGRSHGLKQSIIFPACTFGHAKRISLGAAYLLGSSAMLTLVGTRSTLMAVCMTAVFVHIACTKLQWSKDFVAPAREKRHSCLHYCFFHCLPFRTAFSAPLLSDQITRLCPLTSSANEHIPVMRKYCRGPPTCATHLARYQALC